MPANIKTGLMITGDASGAIKATKLTRDHVQKLEASTRKASDSSKKFRDTTEKANKQLVNMGKLAGVAATALGTLASAVSVGKLVSIEREFGRLNGSLRTATGSAENAKVAFGAIARLATTLPSSVADVTNAFIKMRNLGLDPSESAIRSYANTAAAMGKDLNQMVEAVADAATGEFERLKEFGIKARQQGDEVSFTFQGTTTTIKKSSEEITRYLRDIGEVQFAGAAAEQMNTLDGRITNLQDSWDRLFRAVNDQGVGDALKSAVSAGVEALDELTIRIESGEIGAKIEALTDTYVRFFNTVSDGFHLIAKQSGLSFDFISDSGQDTSTFLGDVFTHWADNVTATIQLMTVEVITLLKKIGASATEHSALQSLRAEQDKLKHDIAYLEDLLNRPEVKDIQGKGLDFANSVLLENQKKLEDSKKRLLEVEKEIVIVETTRLELERRRKEEIEIILEKHEANTEETKKALKEAEKLTAEKKKLTKTLQENNDVLSQFAIKSASLTTGAEAQFGAAIGRAVGSAFDSVKTDASDLNETMEKGFRNVWVEFARDGGDAIETLGGLFKNQMLNSLDAGVFKPIFDALSGKTKGGLGEAFSNIANDPSAVAGIGQFVGTQIGGNSSASSVGSGIGTIIGGAIGGPVGAAIGGLLGGIGGGLFGGDDEPEIQVPRFELGSERFGDNVSSNYLPGSLAAGQYIDYTGMDINGQRLNFVSAPLAGPRGTVGESAFGRVGLLNRGTQHLQNNITSLVQTFVEFDDAVAQFLTQNEIARAADALNDFVSGSLEFTTENFYQTLTSRLDVIDDAIDSTMTNALRSIADASTSLEEFNTALEEFARLAPQLSVLLGLDAADSATLLGATSGEFQQSFIDTYLSRFGGAEQFAVDVAQQQLADIEATTGLTFEDSLVFLERWRLGLVDVNTVGADLIENYQQVFIAGQRASEVVADYARVTEEAAKAEDARLAQQARSTTDAALSALQRSISSEQGALRRAFDTELDKLGADFDERRASARNAAGARIAAFTSQLDMARTQLAGVSSVYAQANSAANAVNPFTLARRQRAQAGVRGALASGNLAGFDLDSAALTGDASGFFGSYVDFARDQALTRSSLSALSEAAEGQMTEAQQTVDLLQAQIEQERENLNLLIQTLDSNQDAAQKLAREQFDKETVRLQSVYDNAVEQVNRLRGIDTTLLSIAEALNVVESSAKAEADYSSYAGGVVFGGGIVPTFASGGYHSGGARIVGERGPELEFTGPSRIISNRRLMDFDGMIKEIRALRSENQQIVRATTRTANVLKKFDYDGLPAERTTA